MTSGSRCAPSLGIEETATMAEILETADQLRAALDVRSEISNVVGGEAGLMVPVVEAAKAVHAELLRLGRYQPGEAVTNFSLRSDRWPPEVDLMAAVDRYLGATKRGVVPDEEVLLK